VRFSESDFGQNSRQNCIEREKIGCCSHNILINQKFFIYFHYSFEKLVGGQNIGDLVRRALLSIANSNQLLNGKICDQLKRRDSIRGSDVSAIESDKSDDSVIKLLHRLGYASSEIIGDDIKIVRYVCAIVSVRNALLSAASK